MENHLKMVDFEKYCELCKHEKTSEAEEPCSECLSYGMNEDSHKPVNWEGKT